MQLHEKRTHRLLILDLEAVQLCDLVVVLRCHRVVHCHREVILDLHRVGPRTRAQVHFLAARVERQLRAQEVHAAGEWTRAAGKGAYGVGEEVVGAETGREGAAGGRVPHGHGALHDSHHVGPEQQLEVLALQLCESSHAGWSRWSEVTGCGAVQGRRRTLDEANELN